MLNLFVYELYSLLIASSGFIFVAFLAGYKPETSPTNIAKATAAIDNQIGITEIVEDVESPIAEPISGAYLFNMYDTK